jgi:hypothetical protein
MPDSASPLCRYIQIIKLASHLVTVALMTWEMRVATELNKRILILLDGIDHALNRFGAPLEKRHALIVAHG